MTSERRVARVFSDVGGYYVCDEDAPMLDARGKAHRTKADALRGAASNGYTHATGSGCPWRGVRRIPARYREEGGA